jgi:hypothetical protein
LPVASRFDPTGVTASSPGAMMPTVRTARHLKTAPAFWPVNRYGSSSVFYQGRRRVGLQQGVQTMRAFFILAALACVPAMAADVAVSVSIGEPGFYGQIDIGTFPRPRLLFPTPIVIQRVEVVRAPLYLRVPPGHEKHWDRHCAEYNACGAPVYFIEDGWYNTVYAPAYKAKHGRPENAGNGHGKGNGKDKGKGKG